MSTHPSEIQSFVAMLDDPDPVVRAQGINGLCPCRVKRNYAWAGIGSFLWPVTKTTRSGATSSISCVMDRHESVSRRSCGR